MADKTTANGTTSARPALEPLRHRPLARASTVAESSSSYPPLSGGTASTRRRSSFLTADSFDRSSFRSSTDSLLLPRPHSGAGRGDGGTAPGGNDLQTEVSSHLHSLPLALALLPAVGGLVFQNGSAVLTDVTLLVLAAVFLNWSVRLPWDWYHSAQTIRLQEEEDQEAEQAAAASDGYFTSATDTIVEEEPDSYEDANGEANTDVDSPVLSPPPPASQQKSPPFPARPPPPPPPVAVSAARELRLHELFALIACFASPVAGAWLLHHIRAQLSRPSEGLVSDYNLSIFLLAAELRPLSHLLRMVQARTLHLQRTVAAHPFPSASGKPLLNDLSTRLDDLEAHVSAQRAAADTVSPDRERHLATSVEATLRKALQPDIDAVTRAVRRYEKRATLLGAQTEARLVALEDRIADAVSLAAGAERASQERRAGPVAKLAGAAAMGVGAVGEGVGWAANLPVRAVEGCLFVARGAVGWMLQNIVGKVVDLKRLGLHGVGDTKVKRRRSSADKPGWKGKEQSLETEGIGAERFGGFAGKKDRGRAPRFSRAGS